MAIPELIGTALQPSKMSGVIPDNKRLQRSADRNTLVFINAALVVLFIIPAPALLFRHVFSCKLSDTPVFSNGLGRYKAALVRYGLRLRDWCKR